MRWMAFCLSIIGLVTSVSFAQNSELAATLEVLSSGVEVQRVNTANWIAVNVEAIVGVGDTIRTDDTGSARITFFADGTDTEILPNSTYRIQQFEGDSDSFTLSVEVIIGQTVQRLGRLLNAEDTYEVNTPGMALAARGTVFNIRVERSGRSAMLVSEGMVNADAEETSAAVDTGFGVRSAVNEPLSDVVRAETFEQLDAALDGCEASVSTSDDVRLNVRLGPSLDFPRVGTVDPAEITRFFGISEAGDWYRISFRDNFGWILSSANTVSDACAGLRVFPPEHNESLEAYSSLGDPIDPADITLPSMTPTMEPEATEEPE